MKIFIICPVRNVTEGQQKEIDEYVEKLESEGHEVHYPPRDVDQSDPVGYDICSAHRKAMEESDRVDIFWDSKSTGSHFDLGQAFALGVPWKLVKTYQEDTEGKSFEKMIRKWEEEVNRKKREYYDEMRKYAGCDCL